MSDDESLDGHELGGGSVSPVAYRPYRGQGSLFTLDAQGQLRNASYSDLIANVDGTTSNKPRRRQLQYVFFNDAEDIEADERVPLNCKIVPRDDMTCALECGTVESPEGLVNSVDEADRDNYQEFVLGTTAAGPTFVNIIVPDDDEQ